MESASGATGTSLGPPAAVGASRAPLRLGVMATGAAVLLLLLAFVVWPALRVLQASLEGPTGITLGHYAEFFGAWRLFRILVQSLAVSTASTVLTVATALVLAYAVTRTDIPGKRFISLMGVLPLVSPPFLVSLAFVLLLGRDGPVMRALGLDWSIHGFTGIVVSQVFTFLPQAYLLLASVFGNIDATLEEAAESLGAGPLTTLRRVTLALARPGLASAALVVFILGMTDFGNPILIGGRYEVLTTEIYAQAIRMSNLPAAATMSMVLLVPCLAAYLVNTYSVGTRSYVTISAGARTAVRATPAAVRWPLLALSGGLALLMALLYVLIPWASLVRLWGSDWALSLRHYDFGASGEVAWSIWNSVKLAAVSGVAGTAVALLAAYVVERARPPGRRAIEALGLLPSALPGTVVGLGYVLAFGAPPLHLAGSIWVLAASVVFWKFPVAVVAGIDALRRIEPAVQEAAVSLGAGRVRTFWRIVMPLLAGTALSIFVYFFINGMVTVSAVIFLVRPDSTLGSVAILDQVEHGSPGVACALGTLIVAIAIGTVGLLRAVVGAERVAVLRP